jgi:hypothetical protein
LQAPNCSTRINFEFEKMKTEIKKQKNKKNKNASSQQTCDQKGYQASNSRKKQS